MAATTGSGSLLNARLSSVSIALLLLYAVTSDRMFTPVRAQQDCPTTTNSTCICKQNVDSYVIVCGDQKIDLLLNMFPALNVSNRQTGTVFRSLSFYPNVQLKNIQMSAFQGLQVNQLNLNDLNTKSIDRLAFAGIGSELKQLVLDNNSIDSLPVGIFDPLGAVQSISLSRNKLSALQLGTFGSSLSFSLRWLTLSDNRLTSIPGTLFANLTSLIGLWLNGNMLMTVDTRTFQGLNKIVWLDLSYNSIASVSSTTFSDQLLLERLWLQGNQLIQLEPGVFNFSAISNGSSVPLELFDLSYNSLSSMPTNDLRRLPMAQLLYLGLSGNLWNCSCQFVDFVLDYSTVDGVNSSVCSAPTDAVNTPAACYRSANCTPTLSNIPDFCPRDTTLPTTTAAATATTTATAAMTTATAAMTTATSVVEGRLNIGLIAGLVVVGVLVVIGIAAAIIAYYFIRKRRTARDKESSNYFGDGNDNGEGTDSTINLMYRLGESRKYSGNPLFETNVMSMQATAAAKGGGGAGEATENPSGSTADGSPSVGEEDVSVASKTGLKLAINTNVVAQNFTSVAKGGTDC